LMSLYPLVYFLFFFNVPSSTAIYTLSLHDALPIYQLYESVTVSLVYALRWTRDSSSLIAVEQIAHGSDAVVLHRNARDWTSFRIDRKSTRLNSSHVSISYAVFCLKKKRLQNLIRRV